jgi:hypothetical protein
LNDKNTLKYMWVYIVFPFFGALLASMFYLLHSYIENKDWSQSTPSRKTKILPQVEDPKKEGMEKPLLNEGTKSSHR